jgi:hypothetical protein
MSSHQALHPKPMQAVSVNPAINDPIGSNKNNRNNKIIHIHRHKNLLIKQRQKQNTNHMIDAGSIRNVFWISLYSRIRGLL